MKELLTDSIKYTHGSRTDIRLFLASWMLITVTEMLGGIGHWILVSELLLIIFLKFFTSFRLYPLSSSLHISKYNVCKECFGFCSKTLSMSNIHLFEKMYHGLSYVIFSNSLITNGHWREIVKNRQAIVYPMCKGMRSDFPDLFEKIIVL